jgi:4-hydroxy-4-methyl-2-oxoglutarate aldolase
MSLNTVVFCRGTTMRKRELDGRTCSVNVDIMLGGVPVRPGDLIFGDSDGVLVIPKEILIDVLEKAEPMAEAVKQAGPKLRESKGVLFDGYGGQALVERLGLEWVGRR